MHDGTLVLPRCDRERVPFARVEEPRCKCSQAVAELSRCSIKVAIDAERLVGARCGNRMRGSLGVLANAFPTGGSDFERDFSDGRRYTVRIIGTLEG